jgi:hypothetical protein
LAWLFIAQILRLSQGIDVRVCTGPHTRGGLKFFEERRMEEIGGLEEAGDFQPLETAVVFILFP